MTATTQGSRHIRSLKRKTCINLSPLKNGMRSLKSSMPSISIRQQDSLHLLPTSPQWYMTALILMSYTSIVDYKISAFHRAHSQWIISCRVPRTSTSMTISCSFFSKQQWPTWQLIWILTWSYCPKFTLTMKCTSTAKTSLHTYILCSRMTILSRTSSLALIYYSSILSTTFPNSAAQAVEARIPLPLGVWSSRSKGRKNSRKEDPRVEAKRQLWIEQVDQRLINQPTKQISNGPPIWLLNQLVMMTAPNHIRLLNLKMISQMIMNHRSQPMITRAARPFRRGPTSTVARWANRSQFSSSKTSSDSKSTRLSRKTRQANTSASMHKNRLLRSSPLLMTRHHLKETGN